MDPPKAARFLSLGQHGYNHSERSEPTRQKSSVVSRVFVYDDHGRVWTERRG